MGHMDNAAGRLRYWIDQLDGWPKSDDALVVAVCGFLDLDPNAVEGMFGTMRLGSELADLCREVRSEVALLPDYLNPPMLLSDFGQVESLVGFFTLSRQYKVSQVLGQVDAAASRGLEYIDEYLHSHRPQPTIPEEDRAVLIDQVGELLRDVTDADDLPPDVREFVTVRLAGVERALRDYYLTGAEGVAAATDALVGGTRTRPDLWDRVASSRWGPRIGKVAAALCLAVSVSRGLGLPALMPGDQPRPEVTVVQIQTTDGHVVSIPSPHHDGGDDEVVDGEIVDDGPPG
ncbi:MAG: hypothetical protein ACRDPH_12695 [Marmoricola sp.]